MPGWARVDLLALSLNDLAEERDAAVALWNRTHGAKEA